MINFYDCSLLCLECQVWGVVGLAQLAAYGKSLVACIGSQWC